MAELPDAVPGLRELQASTLGDEQVVVAVVDGPVDLDHPALAGAALSVPDGVEMPAAAAGDPTAIHGTHVASLIFGQPGSEVAGVAPHSSGLLIPIFDRRRPRVPQLEIARAIERAIEAGAHIINFSGGQYVDSGEPDDWLERAVDLCEERGVLLVAAAGNDGCECLHVPAAVGCALAVGALGDDGEPLELSNWGAQYRANGILAPGEDVLGAAPGGVTIRATGTSAATPIVAGTAALLLARSVASGGEVEPLSVRRALLGGARPCPDPGAESCERLLGGVLDVKGAVEMTNPEPDLQTVHAGPACAPPSAGPPDAIVAPAAGDFEPAVEQSAVETGGGLVYALGTLGYDFGTEARRDSFKQLMGPAVFDGHAVPANPHDSRQMIAHLDEYPSEAKELIWTLNLELTPLYALEASGPFATDVYLSLRELLKGEVQPPASEAFVERVSIPGRLTGQTVRLFSGQIVPVVELVSTRGIYGWRTSFLVASAVEAVEQAHGHDVEEDVLRRSLEGFLNRVYYDMRNLGTLSQDRALNFGATNAFQAAIAFTEALAMGMQLDVIETEPSPHARPDADAWDVKLKFFDPENLRRARRVFRFTVDVSEPMPVTLGQVRSWTTSS